jgi:hypothetical protein
VGDRSNLTGRRWLVDSPTFWLDTGIMRDRRKDNNGCGRSEKNRHSGSRRSGNDRTGCGRLETIRAAIGVARAKRSLGEGTLAK